MPPYGDSFNNHTLSKKLPLSITGDATPSTTSAPATGHACCAGDSTLSVMFWVAIVLLFAYSHWQPPHFALFDRLEQCMAHGGVILSCQCRQLHDGQSICSLMLCGPAAREQLVSDCLCCASAWAVPRPAM